MMMNSDILCLQMALRIGLTKLRENRVSPSSSGFGPNNKVSGKLPPFRPCPSEFWWFQGDDPWRKQHTSDVEEYSSGKGWFPLEEEGSSWLGFSHIAPPAPPPQRADPAGCHNQSSSSTVNSYERETRVAAMFHNYFQAPVNKISL